MSKHEGFYPEDAQIPPELRRAMNELGKVLEVSFSAKVGKRMGFVLLVFDFGQDGRLAYISNAKREDVLCVMNEFITRNAQ